jgi:hypothetical protein
VLERVHAYVGTGMGWDPMFYLHRTLEN